MSNRQFKHIVEGFSSSQGISVTKESCHFVEYARICSLSSTLLRYYFLWLSVSEAKRVCVCVCVLTLALLWAGTYSLHYNAFYGFKLIDSAQEPLASRTWLGVCLPCQFSPSRSWYFPSPWTITVVSAFYCFVTWGINICLVSPKLHFQPFLWILTPSLISLTIHRHPELEKQE